MTVFAYLRVSTSEQDTENQKFGILEYAQKKGFKDLKFISDSVSGKVWWNERKLGDIIRNAKKGDVIIFAEISRIARSTLQVLEVIKECSAKEIEMHIVKSNMVIDNSIQSKTLVVIYGLVAEMERDFISIRTKEALAKKKAEGVKLGRRKGSENKILKLDNHREKVLDLLKNKISITDISKIVEVSKTTLYDWFARNGIDAKKKKVKKF